MQIIIIYKHLNKYPQICKIRNYEKLNQESWHTFSKKKKSKNVPALNLKQIFNTHYYNSHFYTI